MKVKFIETTRKNSIGLSNFSITYSGKRLGNSEVSHRIISSLKNNSYVYLELNSSLLNLDTPNKAKYSNQYTQQLQTFGIQFISKRTKENEKKRILSISLEGRQIEGFEIFADVPNEIWCEKDFKEVIPQIGLRYYIPFENTESNLPAFVDLSEDEKLKLSKMVIFDNVQLGSMGITTLHQTKEDIGRLLSQI